MLNLTRIDKKERLMRAMTGLSLKQFDELLSDFARAYEKAQDVDRSKRGCERKKGAGKKRTTQVIFRADLSEMLFHLMMCWGFCLTSTAAIVVIG